MDDTKGQEEFKRHRDTESEFMDNNQTVLSLQTQAQTQHRLNTANTDGRTVVSNLRAVSRAQVSQFPDIGLRNSQLQSSRGDFDSGMNPNPTDPNYSEIHSMNQSQNKFFS
jgi:hypothetical protein